MPLVPLVELLQRAREAGYGLGYFEAWDGCSLEAVGEAAAEERSPVILGFGGMMVDRGWLDEGGIEALGALGRVRAERASGLVSLLFNEAQTLEQALRAMEAGFNAVMLDTSAWPLDEATAAVAGLVRAAHARGVAVEGELGRLPDATADGIDASRAALTDPDEAAAFVAATGVDCLAVSIGNVHLLTGREAPVDLERLAAIRRRVSVPLVIHGGTSFPARAVPAAVAGGVAKFNIGTVLKRCFLDGVQAAMDGWPAGVNVHDVLGSHKEADFLEAGKRSMKEKVKELMRLYGSSSMA
jgi:fructose-bisphosphate aldolase class II